MWENGVWGDLARGGRSIGPPAIFLPLIRVFSAAPSPGEDAR
jgi:hypothetical protein